MKYDGIVYAPPTEENSLLLQVAIGCCWNRCTFCNMYKDKQYRMRSFSEIRADLEEAAANQNGITQIFLCDGDALSMPTDTLLKVSLEAMKLNPELNCITSYASSRSILTKTQKEWEALALVGIDKVYLGLESGSDKVLSLVQKGSRKQDMIDAANLLHSVGISLAVTFILGLGGWRYMTEHIIETADALNQMQPDYLAAMVLYQTNDADEIDSSATSEKQALTEMQMLLERLELKNCIFTSAHVSNYVHLEGRLPQQRHSLIRQIQRQCTLTQ